MEGDDTPSEEKPRYLLPDGCKDLIDVLRAQQAEADAIEAEKASAAAILPDGPLPVSISIRDPVLVRDLGDALHMPPLAIIYALLQHQNLVATPQTENEFPRAAAFCSQLGVAAHKII